MHTAVHCEQRGHVLLIVLDRPKANAIDSQNSLQLYRAFYAFEQDPALRVAVLTGAGERFFSAGWDLKSAAQGEAVDADHGPGGFAGLTEYFSLSKPVVAAVNGLAVGGGFELALACDVIFCASHAEFFLPEAQIGIAPDSGGVFRLPQRLPRPIAMEMLLSGKRLSAREAERWGLVNAVVESEALLEHALAFAQTLSDSAPLAQRAIKELVNRSDALTLEEAFALQRSGPLPHYQHMLASEDAQEGAAAFAEGRAPVWQGQ